MISKSVSQALMLTSIGLSAALFLATLGLPQQETLFAALSLVIIIGVVIGERVIPFRKAWNLSQGDVAGDIGSFVLIFGALDAGLKWGLPFLILAILPDRSFVLGLPLWQEVVLAFVLIEFGAWVSHFAHHKYQSLWALHAMHHSPRRMYSLNNFRFHPLNHILNHAAMMLVPLALGLSKEALLSYVAITLPILLLQHSNIPFDYGRLNWLINTNAAHRWHHSVDPREGSKNLGRAFLVFDHIFGTFYLPDNHSAPQKVGLFSGDSPFPKARHFLRQLAWPFHPECCR